VAAPSVDCLDTGAPTSTLTETAACAPAGNGRSEVTVLAFDATGRLYAAGSFGAIAGQTRRGLARFDSMGALDPWTADLAGVIPTPMGTYVGRLQPLSLAVLHGNLLVGGAFCSYTARPGGGGYITCTSPLLVFSTDTGSLLRPTDPARPPWFSVYGWWSAGYAISASETGVVVALGDVGVVVLNPVTLDFDAPASAPFLSTDWWAHDYSVGVFALAAPTMPTAGTSAAGRATPALASMQVPGRVVIGGAIPRWGYRVAGNVLSASVTATLDGTRPTVTAPAATVRAGAALSGTSIPLHVKWSGADTGGSGIARFEVQRSANGGTTWTSVSTTLTTAATDVTVPSSGTIRFRVRAVDGARNVGAWVAGPNLTPRLVQQSSSSVRYRAAWTATSSSKLSGGSAKFARAAGASATYVFTGRSIALVATTAPTRGRAKVYVNGVLVATIDLWSATTRYRPVVWQRSWTTSASRTVRIVVVGTAGRPRVDLDALVTLR
jgi:hypothetical protein